MKAKNLWQVVMLLVGLVSVWGVAAQQPPLPPEDEYFAVGVALDLDGEGPMDKVVKGAPYSAQAITETTQTLAEGNTLHRKETAQVFRDSEGRKRREAALGMMGPWSSTGEKHEMVFIHDPVAGVHYVLNPQEKTAFKMSPPRGEKVTALRRGVFAEMHKIDHDPSTATTEESLGVQTIEGVQAQGTRLTRTIAAGEIGNASPITIVSERWYSPELQRMVMTKRNDPRFGETTFRLTGINREEPSPALFQVPSDYTLKEGPFKFLMHKDMGMGVPDAPGDNSPK